MAACHVCQILFSSFVCVSNIPGKGCGKWARGCPRAIVVEGSRTGIVSVLWGLSNSKRIVIAQNCERYVERQLHLRFLLYNFTGILRPSTALLGGDSDSASSVPPLFVCIMWLGTHPPCLSAGSQFSCICREGGGGAKETERTVLTTAEGRKVKSV